MLTEQAQEAQVYTFYHDKVSACVASKIHGAHAAEDLVATVF